MGVFLTVTAGDFLDRSLHVLRDEIKQEKNFS